MDEKDQNPVTISVVIFPDAAKWLKENVDDMEVDHVSSMRRLTPYNPEGVTRYQDEEDGKLKDATVDDHVQALCKLATLIETKKLFVGCLNSAFELTDYANWDVEVVDAFYQLIFHGEVIYG